MDWLLTVPMPVTEIVLVMELTPAKRRTHALDSAYAVLVGRCLWQRLLESTSGYLLASPGLA